VPDGKFFTVGSVRFSEEPGPDKSLQHTRRSLTMPDIGLAAGAKPQTQHGEPPPEYRLKVRFWPETRGSTTVIHTFRGRGGLLGTCSLDIAKARVGGPCVRPEKAGMATPLLAEQESKSFRTRNRRQ